MKKIIIMCVALLGGIVSSQAQMQQAFEVRYDGELLTDGQEVEIKNYEDLFGEMWMYFHVEVTNISGVDKGMRLVKKEVELMDHTSNEICWDQCMDPDVLEAECENFPAGSTTQEPYGKLILNFDGVEPVIGTSIIKYTFITRSKGDPTLSVTVKYTYEKSSGLSQQQTDSSFTVYQPTGVQQFQVTTSLGEKASLSVQVVDLSGRVIQTLSLSAAEGCSVRTDALSQGCYLLVLKEAGNVLSTQKAVIK